MAIIVSELYKMLDTLSLWASFAQMPDMLSLRANFTKICVAIRKLSIVFVLWIATLTLLARAMTAHFVILSGVH